MANATIKFRNGDALITSINTAQVPLVSIGTRMVTGGYLVCKDEVNGGRSVVVNLADVSAIVIEEKPA